MPFLLRLVSLQNTSTRALWPLKLGQFLNGGNPALGRFPQTRTTWDTHSGDKWGSHILMQIWIAQKYRCKRPEPIFGNPHMIPLLYATETTHFANDDEIARKNVAYLPNFTITISIHIIQCHTMGWYGSKELQLVCPGNLAHHFRQGQIILLLSAWGDQRLLVYFVKSIPEADNVLTHSKLRPESFQTFHGFCMVGYHFHGWWFSLSAWISTNFQPGKSRNIQAMCLSLGLSTRWRWHNVSQNTCFQCDKSKYKPSPISPFFCY